MHTNVIARTTALVAVAAALLAQPALAGGEPKNELPFTRPVATHELQGTTRQTKTSDPVIQGEPKNELPFTRPVAEPATVVVQTAAGFDWTDGALGLVAGVGIALALSAAFALTRKSPRTA